MKLYQLEESKFKEWLMGKRALLTTEPLTLHEHGDNQFPIAVFGTELRIVTCQQELNWLKKSGIEYSWYSVLITKCEPAIAREMQNAI